ncbi:MAG: NUDIX hydrolase [Flavobacteriaceae bacterium]|nr:NUDIX hydrolase [Flavobacteriaceae bacterium]|tara:strand:+ start:65197 stop:65799 length:603 start_codon:yes stop_codon:yes gene_type:complete
MYKVFINDKPIIITSSYENEEDLPVQLFKETVVDEIIYRLKNESLEGIILFSDQLESDWKTFQESFKVVRAGGGLVLNDNKDILFIYRNDKWDLPKGRIEKGESVETTAIREVEEECGINGLKILQKLVTTFHIYFQDQYCLKETHWFLMKTDYSGNLTPQLEEGITKVAFIPQNEIENIIEKSYKNIDLTYNVYKSLNI